MPVDTYGKPSKPFIAGPALPNADGNLLLFMFSKVL
jgi:hypothetical protein